jgi:O-antigen ligase/Flp pilus assembly protein TadD
MGAFGVPSVLWLGLRNPFGPPKAFILGLSAACVLLGLALSLDAVVSLLQTVRRSRLAWAIGALVAVCILATLTAVDVRQAFLGSYPDYRGLVSVLAYAVVGAGAIVLWQQEGGARWLGRSMVVCVCWVCGVGLLHRLALLPEQLLRVLGDPGRLGSTLGNSSNFGAFLGVLLPLVVWVALRDDDGGWRVAAWAATGLASVSLILTLSRGAWLAAIVAVVLGGVLFVWRGHLVTVRTMLIAGAAIVVLVVALSLTPAVAGRAAKLVDAKSPTAVWRFSTWESAAAMSLARPFLGFGPNTFHLAYPAFQAPGQVDGKRGYPIVEAAHNLELDTATSFGIPGLLLLVLVGFLAISAAVRATAVGGRDGALGIALGVALASAVVSLQFHYVTMDLGPILAVVLAGLVYLDARIHTAETAPATGPASEAVATRWALVGLGVAYAIVAVGALGVAAADGAAARASQLVAAGAPWEIVSAQLTQAEALAPWETQITRARGTVATAAVMRRFDEVAAADGMRAFDRSLAATPGDAVLAAERANLLLVAGISSRNRTLLARAADAFSSAQRMDPNTGVSLAGQGSALLALGRIAEATPILERAVALSPRYKLGWENLGQAYKRLGRTKEAKHAAWQAGRL